MSLLSKTKRNNKEEYVDGQHEIETFLDNQFDFLDNQFDTQKNYGRVSIFETFGIE